MIRRQKYARLIIVAVLVYFNLSWLSAALTAAIAVTTSPAVVMMVAHDLSAEGPVTRRTFILTSLNNLFGVMLFTLLLPLSNKHISVFTMCANAAYRLIGAISLGMIMFLIAQQIARLIGKHKANQFVLFAGMVVLTIGLSRIFNLSTLLTLFTLGVAARNFDYKHLLTEVDFAWIARLFFIILFVITGVQLQLKGLWIATFAIFAFLVARLLAKIGGVWLFAKASRLTTQQKWALSFTLLPMAEIAVGMSSKLLDLNYDLGYQPMIIITAAVAILNIIGPIAMQVALLKTDEAAPDEYMPGALQ